MGFWDVPETEGFSGPVCGSRVRDRPVSDADLAVTLTPLTNCVNSRLCIARWLRLDAIRQLPQVDVKIRPGSV